MVINRHDANSSRLTAVMSLLPDVVETVDLTRWA